MGESWDKIMGMSGELDSNGIRWVPSGKPRACYGSNADSLLSNGHVPWQIVKLQESISYWQVRECLRNQTWQWDISGKSHINQ